MLSLALRKEVRDDGYLSTQPFGISDMDIASVKDVLHISDLATVAVVAWLGFLEHTRRHLCIISLHTYDSVAILSLWYTISTGYM